MTKKAESTLKSRVRFNTAALNAWAAGTVESNAILEKAAKVRDGATNSLMKAARSFAESSTSHKEWTTAINDQKASVWLKNPEKYGAILDIKPAKKAGGKDRVTVKGTARNALSVIAGAFEHGIDFYSEGEPAEMSFGQLKKSVQAARAAAKDADVPADLKAAREECAATLEAIAELVARMDDAADVGEINALLAGVSQSAAATLANNAKAEAEITEGRRAKAA